MYGKGLSPSAEEKDSEVEAARLLNESASCLLDIAWVADLTLGGVVNHGDTILQHKYNLTSLHRHTNINPLPSRDICRGSTHVFWPRAAYSLLLAYIRRGPHAAAIRRPTRQTTVDPRPELPAIKPLSFDSTQARPCIPRAPYRHTENPAARITLVLRQTTTIDVFQSPKHH